MKIPANVKSAIGASLIALPVFGGIGWVADMFTRASVGMIAISHGQEIPASLHQSLLWEMWPTMLAIWAISCGIAIGMAWAGILPGASMPIVPPPPPTFEEWQRRSRSEGKGE